MGTNNYQAKFEAISKAIGHIENLSLSNISGDDFSSEKSSEGVQLVEALLTKGSDLAVKKMLGAALLIAKERNVLPESIPSDILGVEAAALSDKTVAVIDTAVKVSNGQVRKNKAVDILLDMAASRLVAVTNNVIKKGVDFAVNKLGIYVAKACPKVRPIVACAKAIAPVLTRVAQSAVKVAVEGLKEVVRPLVHKALDFAKKLLNTLTA